ncbi:MAG: sensor histidine kinase, partial [Chitinophagaceae bacterium]
RLKIIFVCMHSKGIKGSIAGIIFILSCVLAGILFYGRDTWKRTEEEYHFQLSRTVRETFMERGNRNFDTLRFQIDSLAGNFSQTHRESQQRGDLSPDSLKILIEEVKKVFARYSPDLDSLKKAIAQNGLDSEVNISLQLTHFVLPRGSMHAATLEASSLLGGDKRIRTIYATPNFPGTSIFSRGFHLGGKNFRAEFKCLTFLKDPIQTIFIRIWPLFAFLLVSFLTIAFFSFFTIQTILQQKRFSDQKTDFINNITHEFNTPISTISVATKILQSGPHPMEESRILSLAATIERQNGLLQQMISEIITLSQDASSSKEVSPLNPLQELEIIVEDFKTVQHDIPFSIQLHHHLPQEISLLCSPALFHRVILNILDNAIKYRNPEEELRIQISAFLKNKQVVIEVKDNGIGMKKDQLPYIFERFYRIQAGDVQNSKGMGLGLFFVKMNMTLVKGKVTVESIWRKGSTFRLQFPIIS